MTILTETTTTTRHKLVQCTPTKYVYRKESLSPLLWYLFWFLCLFYFLHLCCLSVWYDKMMIYGGLGGWAGSIELSTQLHWWSYIHHCTALATISFIIIVSITIIIIIIIIVTWCCHLVQSSFVVLVPYILVHAIKYKNFWLYKFTVSLCAIFFFLKYICVDVHIYVCMYGMYIHMCM